MDNPASDELVNLYLNQVTAEQLQSHVTPKQATSIFPDKLLLLSRHLEKRLLLPNLSPYEMFVAARDQAFFKCLFYPGDRVGDLGLGTVVFFLIMFGLLKSVRNASFSKTGPMPDSGC